jgi:hypothetical protein
VQDGFLSRQLDDGLEAALLVKLVGGPVHESGLPHPTGAVDIDDPDSWVACNSFEHCLTKCYSAYEDLETPFKQPVEAVLDSEWGSRLLLRQGIPVGMCLKIVEEVLKFGVGLYPDGRVCPFGGPA